MIFRGKSGQAANRKTGSGTRGSIHPIAGKRRFRQGPLVGAVSAAGHQRAGGMTASTAGCDPLLPLCRWPVMLADGPSGTGNSVCASRAHIKIQVVSLLLVSELNQSICGGPGLRKWRKRKIRGPAEQFVGVATGSGGVCKVGSTARIGLTARAFLAGKRHKSRGSIFQNDRGW